MTSALSLPRRPAGGGSPEIHLRASTTLLLPEPFGPTTPTTPGPKSKRTRSAKLLKPTSSSDLSMRGSHDRLVDQLPRRGSDFHQGFFFGSSLVSGSSAFFFGSSTFSSWSWNMLGRPDGSCCESLSPKLPWESSAIVAARGSPLISNRL